MEGKLLINESGIIRSRIKYEQPVDGDNLARKLRAAFKRHSNRILLVDTSSGGVEYTGAKLLDKTGRIASGLIKQANLKPGQVVLTMCEHTGKEVLLALGIVLAGGALFGSTANECYEEEKVLCELVKPDIIVAPSKQHQLVLKLKNNVASLQGTRLVWMDNPLKQSDASNSSSSNNNNDDSAYYADLMQRDQVILFDDLMEGPLDDRLVEEIGEKRIDASQHHATYMLTSGSTGRPKVVPNTHEELVHGLHSMLAATKFPVGSADSERQVEQVEQNQKQALLMSISEASVFAGDLPLDHGAGVNTMFLSIILGARFIVMASYDVDTFWQAVNDYKISASMASTTFAYKLLTRLKELIETKQTDRWDLSSLEWISCAGSKLAFKSLVKQVNQVYKHLRVGQCYGCTEIGFICKLTESDCREHLDSVGYLFPGLLAKIVDPQDGQTVLGANKRGELLVWANSKLKNYKCHWSEDAKALLNACHDQDGFYKTGDQAHYDHEGRIYIHGRFKETLFLMEDWKILPAELEELIDQHPLVEKSAVIGVPDLELAGCDAPKAFVKLISIDSKESICEDEELETRLRENDRDFIVRDIYQFVAERAAKPKHLKGGIRILDEFPTVGLLNKVDRKALKLLD